MVTGTAARRAALAALERVENEGAYVNLAIAEVLAKSRLSPADRRLATEIAYGTVSRRLTLDWLVETAAGRPLSKIDKTVLNILRIGFYQVYFLDRVPPSAACNTSVELAKELRRGLAPFVNGVLRGALRRFRELPLPDGEKDPVGYLSLKHAHPPWLVERWIKRLGFAETELLLEANNSPAPVSLRANALKTTPRDLQRLLAREGFETRPSEMAPEGLVLTGGGNIQQAEAFRQGLFQIQGESAMLVSRVLAPAPGQSVLDCCSAPGGKTTHIAELMGNSGEILALDIHEHRLKLVEANSRRLGINIIRTACLDARDLSALKPRQFDRILLDVPCSGFGVLRRKPDLKWRRSPEDIVKLAGLQLRMLSEAAARLAPGGIMVYSTCTNEPEETEQVIERFLEAHPGFETEDMKAQLPEKLHDGDTRFLHIYPHKHDADGFFVCRIKRR